MMGERAVLKNVERSLTVVLALLKVYVLHVAWGHIQGFDAYPWLEVFRATHWFEPLPAAASSFYSYHPPLAYLLCRWIYAIYPHDLEASQILSTLAIIGAMLALRDTLKTIGVLWTLPGMMMLYVTNSLPLVVWLGTETSCDALVFMWMMLALALSARLFWKPMPDWSWRRPRTGIAIVGLALTFAAGLLTKFNTLVAFGLPFLVMIVRRRSGLRASEIGAAMVAAAIGVTLVVPLYYQRYYLPLHHLFPQPVDWLRPGDLATALQARDADRWRFLCNILRLPSEPVTGTQEPVLDSFIASIWLHLWKRDIVLGKQQDASLAVSDFYLRAFVGVILASTLMFLIRHRRLPSAWRDLGYIIVPVSTVYCVLMLYFAWKYPLWDWRIFKGKYVTPAFLWVGYCAVLPLLRRPSPRIDRPASVVLLQDLRALTTGVWLLLGLTFMLVNHVLPVY